MPHKHTRPKFEDSTNFELPPSVRATPLPVGKKAPIKDSKTSRGKRKRDQSEYPGYGQDDTPKAFVRMMQMQKGKKQRDGLDNGTPKTTKKSKVGQHLRSKGDSLPAIDAPRILPHERLAEFSARVDQAIPVSKLERKGQGISDMKGRQTRKEKRMQNMYADWRRQDAARRRREEEARGIAEEEEEELEASMEASLGHGFRDGKKRKRGGSGKDGSEQDDPWAKLKYTREQPRGLHDVAQAPPSFKALPQEKFKVKNGAQVYVDNVPSTAGSLRRREELGKERTAIIENYRKLLSSKKSKQ